MVDELDEKLPPVTDGICAMDDGLEQNLPFTMACVQENFRINPVFTMPLMRKIATRGGMVIDGHFVPEGVSLPA